MLTTQYKIQHNLSIRFGIIGDSHIEGLQVKFAQKIGNTLWDESRHKGYKGYGIDDILNKLILNLNQQVVEMLSNAPHLKQFFPRISLQMHSDARSGLCLAHKDPSVDPSKIANLLHGPELARNTTQNGVYDCLFIGLGFNDAAKDFNTLTIQTLFQLIKENAHPNDSFSTLFKQLKISNQTLFIKLTNAFEHIMQSENKLNQIMPEFFFNANEFVLIRTLVFSNIQSITDSSIINYVRRWEKEDFKTLTNDEIIEIMNKMFHDFSESQKQNCCQFVLFLPLIPIKESPFNLFQPLSRVQENLSNIRNLLINYAFNNNIPYIDLNAVFEGAEKSEANFFCPDNIHLTDEFYSRMKKCSKYQINCLLKNTIRQKLQDEIDKIKFDLNQKITATTSTDIDKTDFANLLSKIEAAEIELTTAFPAHLNNKIASDSKLSIN